MLSAQDNELLTRTGPGTPAGELFRRFWTPALLSEELPAPDCPPLRLRLLGEDLVAFRASDGTVGVLDARCPHRRADLFFGRNEEQGLRCVYHGWKFDVAGNCVDMPNEPAESNFKSKITTTAYPAREWGGLVWVYMGPQDRMPELPQFEWALVPDSHRYIAKIHTECNYLQAVEGDIDQSHGSFLHSYMDVRNRAEQISMTGMAAKLAQYQKNDTAPRFAVKDADYGVLIGAARNAEPGTDYWHVTHWLMPSYALIGAPQPGATAMANIRAPMDDENSWFFRVTWNPERPLTNKELSYYRHANITYPEMIPGTFRMKANKDNDFLIDRALQKTWNYTGIMGNVPQDRAVTDTMGPIVDRTREHLGTSDTAIIAMRRVLKDSILNLQQGLEPFPAAHGEAYRIRSLGLILDKGADWAAAAQASLPSRLQPA